MSMTCPECGKRPVTFWQLVSAVNPAKTIAPTCSRCGASLVLGLRSRRLLQAFVVVAGLCAVTLAAVAWESLWSSLPFVLGVCLLVLVLTLLLGLMMWRFGDYEVRSEGSTAVRRAMTRALVGLIAVAVVAFVVGFARGALRDTGRLHEAGGHDRGSVQESSRDAPAGNREPIYEPDEAVAFVHGWLPEELQDKLSWTDVRLILDLEFEYLRQEGLVVEPGESVEEPEEPVKLDTAAMIEFIRAEAGEYGRHYTADMIHTVLDGETEYMRHIGIGIVELDKKSSENESGPGTDGAPSSPE